MTEPSPPPAAPSEDARRIAQGGQPKPWTYTAEHKVHGSLTFTAQLPVARTLMQHSVLLDEQLAGLDVGVARGGTLIFAAAIAGLTPIDAGAPGKGCLIDLPIISEKVQEHDGGAKIQRRYYQASEEIDTQFLIDVWLDFSNWRQALLGEVDAVKGSSGGQTEPGSDSSELSSAPSGSLSTIPD